MEILDQTPSSSAKLPVAGDGNRIVAYLIDIALVVAVSIIPFVGWFFGLAYMLTRDGLPFLDGRSIGKKVMKLRAVSAEDDQPLTNNWGPAIIRNIVLFIPFFPIIELIVMLTNEQKLRLGDQWAKTRVVQSDI